MQQPVVTPSHNAAGDHIGWRVEFEGVVVYLSPDSGDDGAGVDVDVHDPNDYYENLFVPKEDET